jgi:hypothetical protein
LTHQAPVGQEATTTAVTRSQHFRDARSVRNVQVPVKVHGVEQLANGNDVEDCGEDPRLVELEITHFPACFLLEIFHEKFF